MYGYGSYGVPSFATFNSNRFSLLDRGVVFALAHIRGGGDWASMARRGQDDEEDEHVHRLHRRRGAPDAEKYTSRDRLAIQGGSAGGLLMGAVTNLRPDLCKVAVSRVPFVDVINTMLDESLPLTVGEFEEWGNPKKKDEYDYMKSYCPYDNLAAQAYPRCS